MYTAGVITVSDSCSSGRAEDKSGVELANLAVEIPAEIRMRAIVPDDREHLLEKLKEGISKKLDFVFTTGGTGIGPRDITPEVTREVIEKEVLGIAELLRIESLKHTPMAALSRAVAGISGKTLIINLPGSPKAVRQCMEILMPVLRHAPDMLAGKGH